MKFILVSSVLCFINDKVKITTNLGTTAARQTIEIKAKATADEQYHLQFKTKPSAVLVNNVPVKTTYLILNNSKSKGVYDYVLGEAKKDKEVEYKVYVAWDKVAKPFPKVVDQLNTDQMYYYSGDLSFYSPYTSASVEHFVKLPNSRQPKAYTDNAVKKGKDLLYKFDNVNPATSKELFVHYYNNHAALTAKTFKKQVKVAYWVPKLHFQEDYELHHEGAKLKGQFSRVDYKLHQYAAHQTNVLQTFQAILPPNANDVFMKDLVGNVSTTHFRNEKKQSVLEIQPRYPMYGGWRYSWWHGWTVDFYQFGSFDEFRNVYTLKIPATPSVRHLAVDHAEFEVILPEGAKDVKVQIPFEFDSKTEYKTFTYFDSVGRPTVKITRDGLVDELNQPIIISYEYTFADKMKKPILVSAIVIASFSLISFLFSLDLSIAKSPEKIAEEKLKEFSAQAGKFYKKESKAIKDLEQIFSDYKSSKNLKEYESKKSTLYALIESSHNSLSEIAEQSRVVSKEFAAHVEKISNLLKQRFNSYKKHHETVVKFIESKSENEQDRKKIGETIKAFDSEVDRVGELIETQLSSLQ
ncbi:proteasome regulatory particle base subunit [Boothiomyces sp. JEL0866]|nr:proteasome regulatory particle base subunit [Boothiomyces sp. JEL0866]